MTGEDLKNKIIGRTLAFVSGVCIGVGSLFVKLCGHGHIPVSLILLVKSLFAISSSICTNCILWKEFLFPEGHILFLSGIGTLTFVNMYSINYSIQTISLGEVTVIIATSPLLVALFERVWYKTTLPITTMMFSVMCCVGVGLMTVNDFSFQQKTNVLGIVALVIAAVSQPMYFIASRFVTCIKLRTLNNV